ncbi:MULTISPECIES: peptidoglycan DD-metalloendopeptidase family protein [unclassified Streptomyces]|uniref:M23 family metallopeptidase n=1 Tax=unclassified Streptomyces TaxID=2593676 RepID=UPI0022593DE3|nr:MULTISPECIES: peptidoglycan DD-metalloendopeptidase family protein [unclassified Streptomyces]MCX5144412.1 peptidoglycan DD-metalloendopeptidase family protein [Streptomyces sp. NBC_00338]WRZ68772.1 peptidoglycan DD-metalloendopeptidase family protein [Streptomyces sp. NBC_01257]WSU62733.1 peptidoglycan DD-metalloendopeptidase family protein [Streptomyces sp. NBC_01104]
MPISGKHRRPKSSTIARGVVVASAGGAVIALPLLGATGANAAEQAAPATSKSAAATHATPAKPVAKEQAGSRTYSVVSGDYLSKIAAQHKLKGGWEKLYQDNRKVVGDDPSLIFPGMKLTLGGKSAAQTSTGATTPSKAPSKAPAKTETKASTVSNSSSSDASSSKETSAPATQSDSSGYVHPVPGNHTTAYRASGASWSSGSHTGIDFPVATGTSVKAITSGTVVTAGWGGAYGNEVVIKHADGHYSQYGHMSSLSVSAGQTVTAGQQVGLSGATGNATGPHLHFEVRTGPAYGSDIDPIAYLASHGINV